MTAKLHLEGFSFENMKDKLGAVVRSLTSYHRAKGSSTQPFYKNTGIRLATIISLGPYSCGSLSFFSLENTLADPVLVPNWRIYFTWSLASA